MPPASSERRHEHRLAAASSARLWPGHRGLSSCFGVLDTSAPVAESDRYMEIRAAFSHGHPGHLGHPKRKVL